MPFPSVVHLLYTGELPDPATARLIDAVMVASIDHGAGPPSVLAARTAISGGATLPAAAAAGLLAFGEFHGAAVESAMDGDRRRPRPRRVARRRRRSPPAADELVADRRADGPADPRLRPPPAQAIAIPGSTASSRSPSEAGVAGDHIAAALAIEASLTRALGRPVPINIDGAMAAILGEVGFPSDLGNAVFIAARVAGILAHANEERQTMPAMRRIDPVEPRRHRQLPSGSRQEQR